MTDKEKAIDFLECRRGYYASLSTDPNSNVKATKVCGYTLAESANACLMAIEALEKESVLDKIKEEIKNWYWQSDKQALATDPCVVDAMIDLFIRTINKYQTESEE